MNKSKISVIIPVYNTEKHLRKCLDSVIGQTHKNLEIILINDGSVDSSGRICDEYAEKDSRVICIHQENAGVSKSRNKGIELATGDFCHFLDSDDYIELDTYEFLLNTMVETDTQAIGFEYFVTYPTYEQPHIRDKSQCGVMNTVQAVEAHMFSGNNFLWSKLLPTEIVKRHRAYEDIYRDEDTLFGFEVISEISKMYYSERQLLHYVQSEESACRGVFRVNQLSAVKVIPIMENRLKSDFPHLLTKWRIGYLHLMIMLYSDMYFDSQDYRDEQKSIYDVFLSMYKKIRKKEITSKKVLIKFLLFKISPTLFCAVHGTIHKI